MVVIIIGVLISIIAPSFLGHLTMSKQNVAKANISTISNDIEKFMYMYGRYPQNLEELVSRPSDIDESKWLVPSLKTKDLDDPCAHLPGSQHTDFFYRHRAPPLFSLFLDIIKRQKCQDS